MFLDWEKDYKLPQGFEPVTALLYGNCINHPNTVLSWQKALYELQNWGNGQCEKTGNV